MCGFDDVQRCNYFEREPIRRTEVEVKVGKLKKGKPAEMVSDGGDILVTGSGGCTI